MNLPQFVVDSITALIIMLGCLSIILLLLIGIYFVANQILGFIFKLSSLRLIITEFRKYYLKGIASGDIEITPIMKWIIKVRR